MEFEDNSVIFKSDPLFYEKEKVGTKPNTVRLVSPCQYDKIKSCKFIKIHTWSFSKNLTAFKRSITDVSVIGTLAGKELIVISWAVK